MPNRLGSVADLCETRRSALRRAAGPVVAGFCSLAMLAGCAHQTDRLEASTHQGAANAYAAAETRPPAKRVAAAQEPVYHKVPDTDDGQKAPPPPPPPMPPEYKHWPPHHPSASWFYPDAFMRRYHGAASATLLAELERALLNRGYPHVFYFWCKDGLAMATPFERIDDEGRPLTERRFDVDAILGARSFREMRTQMFSGYAARYRVIVFILTMDKSQTDRVPSSFAKQKQFLGRGLKSLDDRLETVVVTPQHQLKAFIYEWTAEKEKSPVYMLDDLEVYGLYHLSRTGIPTGVDP
jgi:hypothetical protein